jgi:hypothetical protein
MSKPTKMPACKPTCEPTIDKMNDQTIKRLKLVALLSVNQSSKQVMYCDKCKDDEILSELHNSSNTQPDWHGPIPIGMGQNKTSFKASARVPFTTICSNLSSGLTRWFHSHAVKVPVTSTTQVSFSMISASEIVASVNYADAKTKNALSFRHTASSTLQLVVASIDDKFSKGSNKLNNASSFDDKSSSAFQLVVVSVDWKSKVVLNKPFRSLCLDRIKSKMPFIFQLIVGSKQMYQTNCSKFGLTLGYQIQF